MDWKAAASLLGERFPREKLHSSVLDWSAGRGVVVNKPWSVAFSGGADSLALLLLLWAHWPEKRESLVVLHFNHRLRGRESLAEARFCASVAKSLGLGFETGVWAEMRKGASEAEARTARMRFFEAAMVESGSRALWLGHQLDDVAETLLMRLARGSGTGGLAAPRPVQLMPGGRVHLRPLLVLGKEVIARGLKEAGIPWREDSSNQGRDYLRNRMRHDVIPSWQKASGTRDVLQGASLSRDLLAEDDEALDAWLAEIKPLRRRGCLDLVVLQGKPKALYRRALHRWLLSTTYRGDLSRQGFDVLLRHVMGGRPTRQSLGSEGFAVVAADKLLYQRRRGK